MGARAFSHDSIFIPDGGAENEQTVQAMSQDNILGKVKTLQRQLGKNIKFGQRPSNAIPMKKAGSADASSDEDFFLSSPMEIVTQQDIVLSDPENKSSDTPSSSSPLNLPEARSEMEEKVAPVKPSRPKRHLSPAGTIESVNLDAIPLAIARLDNSAAKHKLSVKPKNQRVSRKHRWLSQDRQNEPGSFERQPSLDQNGQPGEDKHIWHEEEPEPLDSREDKRLQEEYWRELEAKCKRQKAEAAEKRRLEEERRQALERRLWEESLKEELLEEEELQLEAGKAPPGEGQQSGLEEQGGAELGEADDPASPEAEKRRHEQEDAERHEEALRQWDAQRQAEKLRQCEAERQEEELRQQDAQRQEEELRQLEAQRQEEELRQLEAQRQAEELRQLEAQRQHAQEEEARKMLQDLRQEEEEEAKYTEELKVWEMEAPGLQMGESPRSPEGESQPQLGEYANQQSPLQRDFEKPEEQENLESVGQKVMAQEQKEEAKTTSEPDGQREDLGTECSDVDVEGREATQTDIPLPQEGQMGRAAASEDKNEAVAADKDRNLEELRWQEVEERQTMPRPYTFQVSSGSRQILFPKVNLSPVTPAKDAGLAPVAQEPPVPSGATPHALPSALSIPHTAILVTGAQLCGPAVNLSQIKDTACKSLLGLSEEKRQMDVPTVEPRATSGKARPPPESPSNATALAEWASIRSRILKNADGDQRSDREPAKAGDEPASRARCDSRGNMRRTQPVKFSIMPAWQKFSDGGSETSKQSLDGEGMRKRSWPAAGEETTPPPLPVAPEPRKSLEKQEVSQEPDTTDGCKFAKDLPSFLVPGLPSPQKAASRTGSTTTLDSETTGDVGKPDLVISGGEEKASPFGIKLRRTNYSLRFHCDQQAEQKKKKRHSSTGDTLDGGTPATGSDPGEKESEVATPKHGTSHPQEKKPTLAPRRDSAESPSSGHSVAVAHSGLPQGSQTPAPEQDKAASKTPPMQKPALAPKPTSQTPPSSPFSKLSRPHLIELLARRTGKVDSEPSGAFKSQESSDNQPPSPSLPEELKGQKKDEEEVPEKKPASPPPSASQQERPSLTPETGRKEKPVLQSRHSVDGSKLTEKGEAAQPLWITLALQKQKGFREQQATREERKQAREAKQAEKLCKETVSVSPQPGSRAGSLHKSATPSEEKKPETAVSRLQRREQLKKANTLPTSVTVEISDSAPPAPPVKEVTKRFSTPDAAPVSTEPAWLALAKRKAKAWSDCPQIIK
nr:capping protein-inhibiting regulator of actin dynamics isoform X1 [Myodes glareolus]XP_048270868.1 capping protein-inhibiting regulator of actin dynamics isoform X1 [Myodes glareolus]XP_048270869.1 capping protein-inhibiting regulator of actin dynamics isoform X1 [Myodes glareolus]XP_048270870.1 capping protein-inhibiting regulator of actin dynamics isoform X1 [Myodes glareolus]XP_048270874.1 capping protein-inhibiting regulator of actin dynamics isoform X1 [Myodes glareolus]